MNTKSSLFTTLLLVLFCVGFNACKGDSFEPYPPIDNGISPEGGIDKVFSEYIKNSSNIICKDYQVTKDSILLSGIKDKHLWFAYFNKTSKKQISEWVDIQETDIIQNIHIGYGEYKTFTIREAFISQQIKTSTGYITDFFLRGNPCTGYYDCMSKTIFTSNLKMKSLNTFYSDWYIQRRSLSKGYKESIFINKCCYSSEGDTIYVAKEKPSLLDAELISYEEGIRFKDNISKNQISRYNYKDAEDVWITPITPSFNVPSNAKRNYILLDNSTNIWKYRCEVTFYDGNKKEFIFYINIDSGQLQQQA